MSSSPAEAAPAAADAPATPASAWFAEALRTVRYDLVMFVRTAVAMTVAPTRFAADWRDQRLRALNPLAFLGTAIAVGSPPALAVSHFAGQTGADGGLWDAFVADQVAPYVQYFLLGVIAHGLLRVLGGRQRLLGTVGIALFAGGGPAMLIDLLTLPLDLLLGKLAASGDTAAASAITALTTASIVAANLAFFVAFARGLAGLHGVRLWRPVLALALAYVVLLALRIAFFLVVT